MPLVSVVIPVYRGRYLREAIDSVRAQTFRDYEIIVVDDGSPDWDNLEAWLGTYRGELQCLRQPNRGPSAARNAGVRVARGTFVAFLDADDRWDPTYLEAQVATLNGPPVLDVSCCTWMTTDDHVVTLASCTSLLRDEYQIILSGVVARREAVLDAGLFDERFRHGEDFDLWLRMLKRGAKAALVRGTLVDRRIHDASLSYDFVNHGEKALLVLEKFRGRSDLTAQEFAAVEWRLRSIAAEVALERAKRAVATGRFAEATDAVEAANRFYRSFKLGTVAALLRLWPGLVARLHRMRERHRAELRVKAERP